MKEILANTFTPIYDQLEDRLRLVINYEDIQNRLDFMITRAFILNLIPSADEFILKHYGEDKNYLNNIKVSASIEENKLEKNVSKTDNVNLELYRTDEQLLTEVNFSYHSKSKLTTIIFCAKTTKAKATLDSNMIRQVFDTVKTAIPNFTWGISNNF
ncbi:MAG: hypothetical protein COB17_10645 [Sulfurimonas sp.]|nr:MAG: hypothetical protein COB17_10645 [Sulfurimonas sp.]